MHCKTVKFKGQDIQVRELTVAELDAILADDEATIMDRIFDGSLISEAMVRVCTGIEAGELRASYPSELAVLVEAVKEVNPDFLSGMTNLLARRGRG